MKLTRTRVLSCHHFRDTKEYTQGPHYLVSLLWLLQMIISLISHNFVELTLITVKCFSLLLMILLKSTLTGRNVATPAFLCLFFLWFPPNSCTSNLFSLYIFQFTFSRQCMLGHALFIPSDNVHLTNGVFVF